ncbi:MAG: TRAP transporter small permease subunit [Kofleriaceae bacterium]|nr:TRAP transporter small permease subunit [Kofleriaceae bacterium]MCL4223952.1 TRAP transporter small permease subunit [Myxococcales bacterium]
MSAPLEPPTAAWTPTFPRIRRVDHVWYQLERWLCGGMFLVMALLVFGSVINDSFGTRREWTDVAALFGLCVLGVRTRAVKDGEAAPSWPRTLALAAAATAVVIGLVLAAVWLFEGHSIMIQKLALVMMIWVALLGASMATYERSHLSLEFGEKVWPLKVLHVVKAAAHGVASGFCLAAFLLSVNLVASQRQLGVTIEDTEWLALWQAFLVVPYAFGAMAVRFLAQAATVATGKDEPLEERLPT